MSKCKSDAKRTTIYRQNTTTVIETDDDYTLDTGDDQVHVTGKDDPDVASVTLTMPCNPQLGEQHLLVAAGAPITVDGNGNAVDGLATSVAKGHAALLTFSRDEALDECDAGRWVPVCCNIAG